MQKKYGNENSAIPVFPTVADAAPPHFSLSPLRNGSALGYTVPGLYKERRFFCPMSEKHPAEQKPSRGRALWTLFITFLKIGAFTFGGGYAMIALLENEFVSEKKWMTKEDFLDMVAIAESTPGPIAVNSATYIGYKTAGITGSVLATFAVCFPAFCILFAISLFFEKFIALKWVRYAFNGIQACVIYLILSAGIKLFKGLKKNALTVVIFVVALTVFIAFSLLGIKFSTIFYILICAALGIILIPIINKKNMTASGEESGKEEKK